jgi:hypothetical protein
MAQLCYTCAELSTWRKAAVNLKANDFLLSPVGCLSRTSLGFLSPMGASGFTSDRLEKWQGTSVPAKAREGLKSLPLSGGLAKVRNIVQLLTLKWGSAPMVRGLDFSAAIFLTISALVGGSRAGEGSGRSGYSRSGDFRLHARPSCAFLRLIGLGWRSRPTADFADGADIGGTACAGLL